MEQPQWSPNTSVWHRGSLSLQKLQLCVGLLFTAADCTRRCCRLYIYDAAGLQSGQPALVSVGIYVQAQYSVSVQ